MNRKSKRLKKQAKKYDFKNVAEMFTDTFNYNCDISKFVQVVDCYLDEDEDTEYLFIVFEPNKELLEFVNASSVNINNVLSRLKDIDLFNLDDCEIKTVNKNTIEYIQQK